MRAGRLRRRTRRSVNGYTIDPYLYLVGDPLNLDPQAGVHRLNIEKVYPFARFVTVIRCVLRIYPDSKTVLRPKQRAARERRRLLTRSHLVISKSWTMPLSVSGRGPTHSN